MIGLRCVVIFFGIEIDFNSDIITMGIHCAGRPSTYRDLLHLHHAAQGTRRHFDLPRSTQCVRRHQRRGGLPGSCGGDIRDQERPICVAVQRVISNGLQEFTSRESPSGCWKPYREVRCCARDKFYVFNFILVFGFQQLMIFM